jgi:hypothetical protein
MVIVPGQLLLLKDLGTLFAYWRVGGSSVAAL